MSKQIREWIKSKKQINENQIVASPTAETPMAQSPSPSDFMKTIQRLSVKLGEKASKYMPLIRYVARNPKMLPLLEELIEQSSGMQVSKAKQIFKI